MSSFSRINVDLLFITLQLPVGPTTEKNTTFVFFRPIPVLNSYCTARAIFYSLLLCLS